MKFSIDSCKEQVEKLLEKYPKLFVCEECKSKIVIKGSILVFREVNDYTLRKEFPLEIVIPLG